MVLRFFTSIRSITGEKEIEWGEPTPTLGDLLAQLSDCYGPEFRRWGFEGDALSESIVVVVNGEDVRHQGGLDMPLRATDVIAILPMMAGGNPAPDAIRCQCSLSVNQIPPTPL